MKQADKIAKKEKILSRLMHFPNSALEENLFLKELAKEGLVEKNKDNTYSLTAHGKKETLFIDGATGKRSKQPFVGCLVVPINEKSEFLIHHRLKEPFYDFVGLMGGKMHFDETVSDCAARELKEETGLQADLQIAAIYNFLTFDENGIAFNHVHFLVTAKNCKGTLKEKDREGFFEWMPKQKVLAQKRLFIDVPHLLETIEQGKFKIVECERTMKNGEFTGMKIVRETVV